jgi:hypothetical protein
MSFRVKLERLIDCATDAFMDWREECLALEDAYRRWANADELDAGLAFAAYTAGLDREERASTHYEELVSRVDEALSTGLMPKPAFATSSPMGVAARGSSPDDPGVQRLGPQARQA